jgi:hypothetical protein
MQLSLSPSSGVPFMRGAALAQGSPQQLAGTHIAIGSPASAHRTRRRFPALATPIVTRACGSHRSGTHFVATGLQTNRFSPVNVM